MFDIKRCKYIIFVMAVALFFLMGAVGCDAPEEDVTVEEEEITEEEVEEEEEESENDEDDHYETAEEVVPMSDRNVALDEDLSSMLEEIFEEEAKLVQTGEIDALAYVVDRVITPDDVSEMKDLLEENGYETVGTQAKENFYDLNLSVSEDVLEERYDGEMGGNMYLQMWTAEEGEDAQKIVVKFL